MLERTIRTEVSPDRAGDRPKGTTCRGLALNGYEPSTRNSNDRALDARDRSSDPDTCSVTFRSKPARLEMTLRIALRIGCLIPSSVNLAARASDSPAGVVKGRGVPLSQLAFGLLIFPGVRAVVLGN